MNRDDRNDALHGLADLAANVERLGDELDVEVPDKRIAALKMIHQNLAAQIDHLQHLIARQTPDRKTQDE